MSISSSWFTDDSFVDVGVVGGKYVGAAVDAFFSFTARKCFQLIFLLFYIINYSMFKYGFFK